MPDQDKDGYIKTIRNALTDGGALVLAEIFFDNKDIERLYYRGLLDAISADNRTAELEQFLDQTANSTDFEFKVPKAFADDQFRHAQLFLAEELKIWPNTRDNNGTFVQIYKNGSA